MIAAGKLEVEADSDYFMESETMSESSFENRGGRNGERREAEKKMKKLRSIKLSRMASTRKGRSSSNQFRKMISGYAASSEQSTPVEMSDASPNHISSCDAEKESFQVLPVTLTRQSSFKLVRSLSRKPSIKFRRSQLNKSSGGTDLKKKLKKSSKREVNSQDDQHSVIQSPHYLKATSSSERATCSSTLKDSKFQDHVEIKPVGSECDRTAASNVCRYSYCSLHGHHHGNNPPLKRFVSMRRRVAKTQKTLKQDRQSSAKETRSGNRKKGIKTGKRDFTRELGGIAVQQTTITSSSRKEEAQGGFGEHITSSLNFEKYKCHSENGVNNSETMSPGDGFQLPNDLLSSACVTRTMGDATSASEENDEDSQLHHGSLHPADSTVAISTDAERKTEMENQKNFTFWKFIYQRMATSLDAELETQKPVPRLDSEEQIENLLNAHGNHDSSQEISQTDQAMSIENDEASSQKLELTQSDAIKMVQQAFDKILSEIPDHSSDDQSIAIEVTSDQDFLLKKQIDGKEADISTSSSSIEDSMVQDQEEMKLQIDNKSEEVKAAPMEGKKTDKQMPNGWSNLKKIIILKRFIKSLEKVRNLKPRTTRCLPMDKDPEAEKIRLRHQNMNGRKNAEEWMLDHALRNVISTLAPSQKRKVALLVQAFETVIPLPEHGDDMRSNAAASSPTTSVLANNESLVHNGDSAKKETSFKILVEKTLYPEKNSKDGQDEDSEFHAAYKDTPKASPESKETSLLHGYTEQPLCIAGSEMGIDMKKECPGAVDIAPSLNSEKYKGHSENGVKNLETMSPGGSCQLLNGLFSSASVTGMMEDPISASEENNEGSQLDHVILHPQDSMAASSTDVACKTKMENQKNFTFWKFIYQRMATGLDAELETQKPVPEVDSEEQVENLHKAHESTDSSKEISLTEHAMSIEDHEASNHKLEFTQSDAIKLVQKAFDKILSEIPDHSSDDQSIAGEITSDQDFMLKKQIEGKEVNILTSSNSFEDCKEQDQEEMLLQTDNKCEEVKAAQMKGKKPDKQMPNGWSNLKKIIILNRFVKSLEKVKNLKPRTIRYLPVDKDPEAEKIQLRHQNMNGRKNGEEWMLDHALRHVISTLAPSQKRKVALLVQAFETVIPLPENGDDMRSNAAASSPATSVLAYNEPSGAVDDKNVNGVLAVMDVQPKLVDLSLSELEEPILSNESLTNEGAARTTHEKVFRINKEVTQRISKEETTILSSEVCNEDSEFNIKKMDLVSGDLITSADVDTGKPECPTEVGDGTQQKYKFLHSSLGHSESNFGADISKLEKQKYTRLWYLIYKHMVSGNAADDGSQLLQNVADEEVQGDDASKPSSDNNADCEGSVAAGQDLKENYRTGSQNIGCHNNEIIKLVEEAIDEIPLPETPDDTSDNQSFTGDVISVQELAGKKNIKAELRSTLNSEEKILKPENVSTEIEVKRETDGGNKSKKRVQRNWSNLKKLILLRRFVKALEKVKEFNPRGPRYLPLNPAPESEKVSLKRQNTDDRKNAEDWMLDSALQQVVAKLTPERKKRVGLLIEAFETVIPTIS